MSEASVFAESLSELRRRSERYRAEVLSVQLGLANLSPITELPRGQVFSADSDAGRVILKFLIDTDVPRARLAICLQHAYGCLGIRVPEIVFADVSESMVSRYGVGCIVSRFVDSTPLRIGDARHERLAFENLARIHQLRPEEVTRLELPGVSIDDEGRPLEVEALRAVEGSYSPFVVVAQKNLAGWLGGLRDSDVDRVVGFCEEAKARMREFGLPRVVLHGDYNASNLIFDVEGRLHTIDLDSVRQGPFRIELGTALLRALYGANSRALDVMKIDDLSNDARLRAAEEAYFSVAPECSRKFWDEHREAVLISAYLWTIWRFSTRTQMDHLHSFVKRARYRYQAIRRWKNVIDHLDRIS